MDLAWFVRDAKFVHDLLAARSSSSIEAYLLRSSGSDTSS
jgi:hypothetical protein